MTEYPKRSSLPHAIPSWVEQGARHFVTINCRERGRSILTEGSVSDGLLKSARFYEETLRWHLWLLLIMPDHVHLIATFDLARGLKSTVSAWKRYQKRLHGIEWQSGFFEHRLRDDEEFLEKASYIRMNPVRRGLIDSPEDWPHLVERANALR